MLESLQGLFPTILTIIGAIIVFIVGLAVWKNNKQNTDDNQNKALEAQSKRIDAVENANKEFSTILNKIYTMVEMQNKDIDNLKQESSETDKALSGIKKILDPLTTIPDKLDSLEKQIFISLKSFEKLFEEKIKNVNEKVEHVQPVQKQRFAPKLKGKTS
ncbi:MAG: hypothetical protein NTW25_02235 [Candidatus Kapabacteria bacterium]|nr:hypothetical protein [Candidatus Kapabacteria bacterium]